MKIMMPIFSRPLEFSELQIPVIVIENKKVFYDIVSDVHNQIEGISGDVILSDRGVSIDFEKKAKIIIDTLSLDCNERKIVSSLQKSFAELAAKDESYFGFKELQRSVNLFIQNLSDKIPFPVIFSDEIPILEIIKGVDLRFDFDSGKLSESLVNYLTVLRDFDKRSCFFICNLKTWIEEQDLQNFYKDVIYRKLNIILLENHYENVLKDYEIYRIIDSDLCEIN